MDFCSVLHGLQIAEYSATTIIGILRNRTFFTFESLNKAIYIEMNKLNDEKFGSSSVNVGRCI